MDVRKNGKLYLVVFILGIIMALIGGFSGNPILLISGWSCIVIGWIESDIGMLRNDIDHINYMVSRKSKRSKTNSNENKQIQQVKTNQTNISPVRGVNGIEYTTRPPRPIVYSTPRYRTK